MSRPRRPALPFAGAVLATGALLAGSVFLAAGAGSVAAQDADTPPAGGNAAVADVPLGDEQAAVSDRLRRLEDSLLKMAKYLRRTEPERADLILRALQKSKEERLEDRMRAVSELLRGTPGSEGPRYAEALREQESLLGGMREVLGLLRSQDRRAELDAERDRLKGLLKDVNRVLSDQKAAEAATRRGEDAAKVGERQGGVERRTGRLIERIREDDAAKGGDDANDEAGEPKAGEPESGEPKNGEPGENGSPGGEKQPPGEFEPGEGSESEGEPSEPREGSAAEGEPGEKAEPGAKPGEETGEQPPAGGEPDGTGESSDGKSQSDEPQSGEPQSGEPKPGELQPGESTPGEPQDGQPQSGQSQQGQPQGGEQPPGEQQPSDPNGRQDQATPGREQLEEAREQMKRALEELKAADREGAEEAQAEAVRKLTEAKEKLEEILRQLREEEAELVLRSLEARFQKMLRMQQSVLAGTVTLGGTADWGDREFARAADLALDQDKVGLEADRALQLLREEGSSVAFPEALMQIRADVGFSSDLLREQDAGDLTQTVQRDVVEALGELVEALRKELEDMEERKQSGQPPPQQGGEPGEEGLVQQLAELKMLRSLQLGVNRRTRLLGEQAVQQGDDAGDLRGRLRELAQRQARLEQATYDLAVGRND